MRDRSYRRYVEEKILKKRLSNLKSNQFYWSRYKDINGNKHANPTVADFLGDSSYMKYKSIATDKYNTRRKIKFSPKRSKDWYRDNKKIDTREYRDKELLKILKENGIR